MTPNDTPQRRATGDGGDVRRRLLDATTTIVAADGVSAATSRRISDAAEVNLAAITYYFGSKRALVSAALVAEVERLAEPAVAALESDGDEVGRLLDAVQLLLAAFAHERERAPAYLEALVDAAHGKTGAAATRDLVARLRDRVAAVVASLQAGGDVPSWVDPASMASLIVSTANGIVLQTTIDPDGPGAAEQAAQFAQLLLAARPAQPR
jgi:AcrR family transcriptional regulator